MSLTTYSSYGTEGASVTYGPVPLRRRWSRRVVIDVVAGLDTLSLLTGCAAGTLLHRGAYGFAGAHIYAAIELSLMSVAIGHFALRQLGQYDESRVPKLSIGVAELLLILFLVFATVQSVAFTLGAVQPFPRGWQPTCLIIGGLL